MFDKAGIFYISSNIKKQMRSLCTRSCVTCTPFGVLTSLNETAWRLLPTMVEFISNFSTTPAARMIFRFSFISVTRSLACLLLASIFIVSGRAQDVRSVPYTSQELSETDGIPVLLKHLPDWENRRDTARLVRSSAELKQLFGERPEIDAIEFVPGTEAAAADYEQGKLLIVEYAAPQMSIETDQRLEQAILAGGANAFSRRVGNYNVVVFDAQSRRAADSLIDQVKYEKNITWLGNNPFAISAERAFVITTSDIFFSTLMVIVGGVLFSILGGLLVGYLFFVRRERHRASMVAFSDAGGMTRLNLDDLTPDLSAERLLGK